MADKSAVEKVVAETEELPKAIVRRVVKEKLSQLSDDGDISVLREALQVFSESARIFIHYLSATANDICRESKRQTINADDVFKALEEIEFPEFIGPLKASLEEFRQKNAIKKSASKAKEADKKKKKQSLVENRVKDKQGNVDAMDEDGDDAPESRQKNAGRKSALKAKEANKKKKESPVENGIEDKQSNGKEMDGAEDKQDNGNEMDEDEGDTHGGCSMDIAG
ncbi:DNA polymerase II subunit B4 [Sarracenia purpurea var. burkii]